MQHCHFQKWGLIICMSLHSLDSCPGDGRGEAEPRVPGGQQPLAPPLSLLLLVSYPTLALWCSACQWARRGCCEPCSWNYQSSARAVGRTELPDLLPLSSNDLSAGSSCLSSSRRMSCSECWGSGLCISTFPQTLANLGHFLLSVWACLSGLGREQPGSL